MLFANGLATKNLQLEVKVHTVDLSIGKPAISTRIVIRLINNISAHSDYDWLPF